MRRTLCWLLACITVYHQADLRAPFKSVTTFRNNSGGDIHCRIFQMTQWWNFWQDGSSLKLIIKLFWLWGKIVDYKFGNISPAPCIFQRKSFLHPSEHCYIEFKLLTHPICNSLLMDLYNFYSQASFMILNHTVAPVFSFTIIIPFSTTLLAESSVWIVENT